MTKTNKKIKPSPPDIGGVPPTFMAASFASTSDKTKYFVPKLTKAEKIKQRRKFVKELRKNQ